MKLRNQLSLFSTAQLLVFGALFAIAYAGFERGVLPMFEGLLQTKSVRVARFVSTELDVALGADDVKLMEKTLQSTEADPDFHYVVVRDPHGHIVYEHGKSAVQDAFAGAPLMAVTTSDGIRTWAQVSLEGMPLGSVAVVFSTARLDSLAAWASRLALGATALWLVVLGYSIVFARSFVSPIRAMMDFSRRVAGGALCERLAIDAPGELGDLRDYLNQMTAELERREDERRLAATKAEDMQRKLLAVSRTAGMAEIATGVLHNVGNVLNSLNVSVGLIGEQVRNSKLSTLTKSIDLFEGFPGGLPAFLGTDKGKVLPGYLCSVSRRLVEENQRVLSELESVTRNVDHIKSIVAMQQSYARHSGMSELVELAPLIDDALRMGESSFARHGIEVIQDCPADAKVVTDRHKLLQILINLISNSRHALKGIEERDPRLHRLTVSVRRAENRTTIEIADTGVGIPAEHLAKIFQHGFTTKQGGHGFGLHASAIAARELGGTLSVVSGGPGCGATFTLGIPDEPESVYDRPN